jgi:hypothetical protein
LVARRMKGKSDHAGDPRAGLELSGEGVDVGADVTVMALAREHLGHDLGVAAPQGQQQDTVENAHSSPAAGAADISAVSPR